MNPCELQNGLARLACAVITTIGTVLTEFGTDTIASTNHGSWIVAVVSSRGETCGQPDQVGRFGATITAIQHPTLLGAYPVRPRWCVAGVDYAVGPRSTPIKDPATISVSGVSVDTSSRTVFVSGNNITLDGYDFSLHGGYQVAVTGANVTISDSNFVLGTNAGAYLISGGLSATNLTIKYCTMDASTLGNQTSLIGWRGTGTLTVEYNWLKNFPQHVVEMTQPHGTTFSLDYEYNLIEQGSLRPGSHLNFLQFGDGTGTSITVAYNTTYQTPQVSGGEGFQFYMNVAGSLSNVSATNNTMIATGGPQGSAMSYMFHAGVLSRDASSTPATGVVNNNYLDFTSGWGAFYPGLVGFTYSGNINMKNGKLILGNNVQVDPP
jgi:hypothetical protein